MAPPETAHRPLTEVRFRQLCPARRTLIRLMQRLGRGEIRNLFVLGGKPAYDPPPTILSDRPTAPRREATLPDFVLKAAFVRLIADLTALGDGRVHIRVLDGLPALVEFPSVSSLGSTAQSRRVSGG